jgi:radical SAM protein with 4Fe4S-binding SPASM domain
VDGATQETYEQYRIGGSIEKALAGISNTVDAKKALRSKSPYIILQFLATRQNEHEVSEIRRLGKTMGVDEVRIKTAQFYDFEKGNPLMPLNPKLSRYRPGKDGSYQIKNALLNHCWKMWHSCVITWDGLVVPCCFDKDAKHVLGDLKKQTFDEIWFGEAYREFRNTLLKARKKIDICANCTEGTKVWA